MEEALPATSLARVLSEHSGVLREIMKGHSDPFAYLVDAQGETGAVGSRAIRGVALRRELKRIFREKPETFSDYIETAINHIKETVGDKKVILALSGGVDSSVAAVLIHRAIGDQLNCFFVDTGLMRKNEAEKVMATYGEHYNMNIECVEAEERFLSKLAGVSDPEEKRKIIGHEFIAIFDEQKQKFKDADFLAQGTIYPDVIESAASKTGKAHVIKSHHNVGGLPDDMEMGLVEPLRELFKDEVREIGLELGLPYNMLYRHPFPGPGLGVRVLGNQKRIL